MKRTISLLLMSFLLMGTPLMTHAEETNIQEEIIYDIVVDRYNNGNLVAGDEIRVDDPYAYHGGDLRGIIKKLDYIESLGFSAISLSSIMKNSEDGYHGYWIDDMYEIEPLFGTMEDLQELVEEAHKREMDVYVEFVLNYVSEDHPFVTDETKEDWLMDAQAEPTDATFWLEHVKQLQLDNEEVQEYMFDVAEYWATETEINGFVIHAADQAPAQFVEEFSAHMKEINPTFMLIVDLLNEDAPIDTFVDDPHIDAVQNYVFYEKMNDVFSQVNTPLSDLYAEWNKEYEEKSLLFVDTKNTPRFSFTTAEQSRSALTTWQLALTFMYTAPGTPIVLQGSELPMYGPTYLESQYLVPFNSTDPDLEEFHHRISSLREEFPVLRDGEFEQVIVENGMSVFKRYNDTETIYIAINNDEEIREATITDDIGEGNQLHGLLGDMIVREGDEGYSFEIKRESAEVFIIEEDTGIDWLFVIVISGIPVVFFIFMIYVVRKGKTRSN